MKNYIDFNTEKRKNAKNEFEKIFLKLMNNSAYGSKPTSISFKNFNKNFDAIHEIKTVLVLNKPIYARLIVLELSKYLMYDFHYGFIKKHFDAGLLSIDADFWLMK